MVKALLLHRYPERLTICASIECYLYIVDHAIGGSSQDAGRQECLV